MEALRDRKTNRDMRAQMLSPQTISNLLWAAWGVNRPATNGRTAPSAFNVQEIDLYVFLAAGVYLFDGPRHSLRPVIAGDHRSVTSSPPGVGTGPVSLVYVADLAKYAVPSADHAIPNPAEQLAWSNAHCGFIAQNVYLYAASEGLACCFRVVEAPPIAKLLNLRPPQKVMYSQGIGYPA